MDMAEAARVDAFMRGLKPQRDGVKLAVTGGLNRPPMVRTPAIVALYARAEAVAAELGFPLSETGTGGGSDGNFTAALGMPTLDGLGVVGDGGHALHEHVILSSLPERRRCCGADREVQSSATSAGQMPIWQARQRRRNRTAEARSGELGSLRLRGDQKETKKRPDGL